MAQTFDIRFERSAGLAGLFEAPSNEFRWKGAGSLSIDASGISIAVQRGLLTLFARAQSHRIATNSLIEVYREGNALRLEFSTRESSRSVLPFWVSDRNAAAQIVTLLPTQRSVELDDSAGSTRKYRFDRRLVALVLVGVVTLGVGALTLQRYLAKDRVIPLADATSQPSAQLAMPVAPDPPSAPPAVDSSITSAPPTTASPAPVVREIYIPVPVYLDPTDRPASSVVPPAESVVTPAEGYSRASENSSTRAERATASGTAPIAPAKSAHEIASEQFAIFRAESAALHSDYLYARDTLAYERLEAIEARWLLVTARIVNTKEFAGSQFYALREMELAVSRNWRDHLRILAAGLRAGSDPWLIQLADAHREFAESVEAQLSELGR